ncbi:amidohydrolase [Halobacteriales archaeon Cl-PHB]
MSIAAEMRDWLVAVRRDLHRYPEPAWCEFYTTTRIVEEIEAIGVDDLLLGEEILAADARYSVPDQSEIDAWRQRAAERGAPEAELETFDGGFTGAIAVLERGEGPTVGLRVDIDALPRRESTDEDHVPAAEGFRADHDDAMHACGHDAHAAFGLGVLKAVADGSVDFSGTLKVFFQPAEEVVGGGPAMAESGHLDDVDYFLAAHIGLDHPTGEVVAGLEGFLAVSQFRADFTGEPAHAGGRPAQGRNAIQAMTTAVQNLYAIPRHEDGPTRINAGKVGGGTASNIVAEEAHVVGETRGETTHLMEYTRDRADRILESAAEMHDCEVAIERLGEAPAAVSDDAMTDLVGTVAGDLEAVTSLLDRDDLGGSEDATYLMKRVQEGGGLAGYVCIGTDHPGGHHTATFDVDEDSLVIGVDVLARSIERLAAERP